MLGGSGDLVSTFSFIGVVSIITPIGIPFRVLKNSTYCLLTKSPCTPGKDKLIPSGIEVNKCAGDAIVYGGGYEGVQSGIGEKHPSFLRQVILPNSLTGVYRVYVCSPTRRPAKTLQHHLSSLHANYILRAVGLKLQVHAALTPEPNKTQNPTVNYPETLKRPNPKPKPPKPYNPPPCLRPAMVKVKSYPGFVSNLTIHRLLAVASATWRLWD